MLVRIRFFQHSTRAVVVVKKRGAWRSLPPAFRRPSSTQLNLHHCDLSRVSSSYSRKCPSSFQNIWLSVPRSGRDLRREELRPCLAFLGWT
jgi:hypothetical protein